MNIIRSEKIRNTQSFALGLITSMILNSLFIITIYFVGNTQVTNILSIVCFGIICLATFFLCSFFIYEEIRNVKNKFKDLFLFSVMSLFFAITIFLTLIFFMACPIYTWIFFMYSSKLNYIGFIVIFSIYAVLIISILLKNFFHYIKNILFSILFSISFFIILGVFISKISHKNFEEFIKASVSLTSNLSWKINVVAKSTLGISISIISYSTIYSLAGFFSMKRISKVNELFSTKGGKEIEKLVKICWKYNTDIWIKVTKMSLISDILSMIFYDNELLKIKKSIISKEYCPLNEIRLEIIFKAYNINKKPYKNEILNEEAIKEFNETTLLHSCNKIVIHKEKRHFFKKDK